MSLIDDCECGRVKSGYTSRRQKKQRSFKNPKYKINSLEKPGIASTGDKEFVGVGMESNDERGL